MKKMKKRRLIFGSIILILFLFFFFLSTFLKKWLVKNSNELIGRKINLSELHINYLKAAVRAKDFVMFETNQADSFISFNELYINFDPWHLLRNEYCFSGITLIQPRVFIGQDGESFNFSDLIPEKDTAAIDEIPDTTENKVFRFTLKNLELKEGLLIYEDHQVNNHLELDELNLDLPLISWDSRESSMDVSFRIGKKGEVNIDAQFDNQSGKYQVTLATKNIDLDLAADYLKQYADINTFQGLLSTQIKIYGDIQQLMNISLSGLLQIDSFLIKDAGNEQLIGFKRLTTNINNLDIDSSFCDISSVTLINPVITAVIDRDMTNFERVLLPSLETDSAAMVTDTVVTDSTAKTALRYRIDTISIADGMINFTDNTLNRPFRYDLKELDLKITALEESAREVPVLFSMNLNDQGMMKGNALLNMVDSNSLDFNTTIERLNLISFSPYAEYFIASPVNQGWMNYNMSLKMKPFKLQIQNKIRIEELEFGNKTRDSTAVKVPIKLALFLLKDMKDVIAFELPVEGDPSDPDFSPGKIIWKTLANFLIKTAAAPFNALAGIVGADPENLEKIPFEYTQSILDTRQMEVLTHIAEIMKNKPELTFTFLQFTDPDKEKEYLAVQLAKKDFVVSQTGNDTDSSQMADMIRNTESTNKEFIAYIRSLVPGSDSLETTAICNRLYDSAELTGQLNDLILLRNKDLGSFLIGQQDIPAGSFKVETIDLRNVPEELKFPHFKVEVSVQ
ncbi:MAG: DUF748 domain-containing protein [Bacteroidales bacterium]|nr:DUF748 domain-containing protein [Bacteroidales bacterium]